MSQTGLLNEDELRDHINEIFGLRLDREAFIRPSKDVLYDIYGRFLDHLFPDWRKPRPGKAADEQNLKFPMVGHMRNLLLPYNLPYEFSMSDILKPKRKQTITFLNALIFIKAQFDEAWQEWQARKEEWEAGQQEANEYKQMIEQCRVEVEKLAYMKADLEELDELLRQRQERKALFEKAQRESAAKSEEAKSIKNEIKIQGEILQDSQNKLELLNNRIEQQEETLRTLNDIPELKKKIVKSEQANRCLIEQGERLRNQLKEVQAKKSVKEKSLEKLAYTEEEMKRNLDCKGLRKVMEELISLESREQQAKLNIDRLAVKKATLQKDLDNAIQNRNNKRARDKIKLERVSLEVAKEIEAMNEEESIGRATFTKYEEELKDFEKKRADLKAKASAAHDYCESLIQKSNNQWDKMRKRAEKTKEITQKRIPEITATQRQIDLTMGLINLTEIEVPADRTYIKESGRRN